MNTQHTRGPWQVRMDGARFVTIDSPYGMVAKATTADSARLIAAAPALLEALQNLRAQCSGVSPFVNAVATKVSVADVRRAGKFMDACEQADAAIAAATGEAA